VVQQRPIITYKPLGHWRGAHPVLAPRAADAAARFPDARPLKAELRELKSAFREELEVWSLLLDPVAAIEAARAAELLFNEEAKLLVKPENDAEN